MRTCRGDARRAPADHRGDQQHAANADDLGVRPRMVSVVQAAADLLAEGSVP